MTGPVMMGVALPIPFYNSSITCRWIPNVNSVLGLFCYIRRALCLPLLITSRSSFQIDPALVPQGVDEFLFPDGADHASSASASEAPSADPDPDVDSHTDSDAGDPVEDDPDLGRARRNSALWWYRNRRSPIVPGHRVTVVQAAYWVAMMKRELRISDAATDAQCRLIHYLLLPADNLFPPSYYLVKAVLGVASDVQCIRHVCDTCWALLPDLDPADYQKEDHCHQCGRTRFSKDTTGLLSPRRSVYYFGDRECLMHLLTTPGMLESIVAHRAASSDDPCSFLNTPAGRALDAACGFKFTNPGLMELAIMFTLGTAPQARCGASRPRLNGYVLVVNVPRLYVDPCLAAGGDGAQVFINKQHGSIIWGLKIHGMHPEFAAKNDVWVPLGLVQGPTEPTTMGSILHSIIEFFAAHDPGMDLSPRTDPIACPCAGPALPIHVCACDRPRGCLVVSVESLPRCHMPS